MQRLIPTVLTLALGAMAFAQAPATDKPATTPPTAPDAPEADSTAQPAPDLLTTTRKVQGTPIKPTPGAISGPPPIRFEPETLDLGELQAEVPKTGKIKIWNITDKAVKITRAIPGCGCTTAQAPTDPIEPGKFAEMDITLKPAAKQGIKLSKKVTFQIENHAPVVLTVEGNVAAYVTISPDILDAPKDDALMTTDTQIRLASADGTPFKVTAVNPPIIKDVPEAAGTEAILKVDWSKWQEMGRTIKVTFTTDHPKAQTLSVMIKRPFNAADAANVKAPPVAKPMSALIMAARDGDAARVTEELAKGGALVDELDAGTGRTALMWAVKGNKVDAAKALIDAKANVNVKDRTGKTALTIAAESKSLDATKLLLANGADVASRDQIGGTPLTWAAGMGSPETVAALVETGADINVVDANGLSPLLWAAGIGSPDTVKYLLDHKATITIADNITGDTALMRAARSGKPESLRLLITAGGDVNIVNKQGLTPLLVAAQSGTPEKVRLLLEAKADRAAKGPLGKTALEIAKSRTDDNGKAISAMLEAQ